jgi:ribosome-associated toxin RatA of RatAB toxin-antitoxin module
MNATVTHLFEGASTAILLPIFADVEAYPSFVPGFKSAKVYARSEGEYKTKAVMALQIGPFAFEEELSTVTKVLPAAIEVQSVGNRFIKWFGNVWHFRDVPGGCLVDFTMAIEFAMLPAMAQPMLAGLIQRQAENIFQAFVKRIEELRISVAPDGITSGAIDLQYGTSPEAASLAPVE